LIVLCDIYYLYGPEEFSFSKYFEIDDNLYSIFYLSSDNKTFVYREGNLVSSLDGEINPFDIIKRIRTIEIFS